jgi:hypothetical protein
VTPTINPLLCCDCGANVNCVGPIHNVCPTPCVPVTPAICP